MEGLRGGEVRERFIQEVEGMLAERQGRLEEARCWDPGKVFEEIDSVLRETAKKVFAKGCRDGEDKER
eukprot:8030862-Lingulodinium_polyedra.AAC.1